MNCKFILFLAGNAQKNLFHFQSFTTWCCAKAAFCLPLSPLDVSLPLIYLFILNPAASLKMLLQLVNPLHKYPAPVFCFPFLLAEVK